MKNTIYNVICEGTSEENYIKEINKFFRENSINVSLYPINVGNGSFSQVYKKFKKVKNINKNQEVVIWVDRDIYKRNDKERLLYQNKSKSVPDFKFNDYNFEDVIVLHLPEDRILEWKNICIENNHFNIPMTSEVYIPLFRTNIIENYEKGNFPLEIFDTNTILGAIRNNNDININFHSDFLSFIQKILEEANFNITQ